MTPPDDADRDLADEVAELAPDERAALARWSPPGPPADFADRVLAAAAQAPAVVRPARRARWPLVAAGGAAIAATVAVFAWPAHAPAPTPVVVAVRPFAARETIALGGRGVAVVEPGAALGWQQAGATLAVRQESGDVFYRVDRGAQAPFTVTTPAGEVRVTGTCFRVEVLPMMPSRSAMLGAAAGAVFATAAVVTVYEGKVLVASPGGTTQVVAGQQVTLDGTAPTPVASGAAPTVAVVVPPEPSATITREDLLVRDKAQREQIAALSTRLKDLESALTSGGPVKVRRHPDGPEHDEDWLNPTKDDLLALAKVCGVKIDVPPVMRGEPMQIGPEAAQAAGLTAEEHTLANQVFVDLARTWKARVRGLYIEATGDSAGADQLSAHAMGEELTDKATPGEPSAVQKRISQERAGLVPAPTELGRLSPFERYFRSYAQLGDEAEHLLAAKIGPEKAHKVRAEEGGWPMRMSMSGCNDEDDAGAER